jgi:predicted metalloprotease
MRWDGGRRSGDVEDRRGIGPGAVGGGLGIGGVVIALIAYFVFGVDPSTLLDSTAAPPAEQQQAAPGSPGDRQGQFVDTVFTSINDTWAETFQAAGETYEKPTIVLYDQATGTGCGTGQAAMGPFYCPRDRKVYLDLSFFQELGTRFGAPGEFAQAYVIAHEVGHHIQTLDGTSDKVRRAQERAGSERAANQYSVRLELQADCYAGVWANRYSGTGRLDPGDIDNALAAASAVGDDTLQKQTRGTVVPDSFTHGSSADRKRWFQTGYQSGNPGSCNTFG